MKPAEQQLADVKIMQKVNAVHRESFTVKYPGQIEHILRLTAERLQAGLDKRDGVDVNNVNTWKMTPNELADLSEAMYYQHLIRQSFIKEE